MKLFCIALLPLVLTFTAANAKEPAGTRPSTQMIIVTTPDWSSPQGTLRRYERGGSGQSWRAVGDPITVMVGKNGLGWGSGVMNVQAPIRDAADPAKKEGDGKAPAGAFHVSRAFGYAPDSQPGWKMPYVNLSSSIECVDDTSSKFYNQVIDRSSVSPDWNSSEHMRRDDELYRWGLIVDYNSTPAVQGNGSCIFMHIWRGPGQPTVGCTAMAQANLEALIGWLDPTRKPLLVQLPEAKYQLLRKHWNLPQIAAPAAAKGSTMQGGQQSLGKSSGQQ
ncbi:MAG TPA: L,D-transpeptidase family protein [Candidatus Angelobacter sp.]|nr:L,D-transpeptidase family protein [Candidatus Angelobacter sp.]